MLVLRIVLSLMMMLCVVGVVCRVSSRLVMYDLLFLVLWWIVIVLLILLKWMFCWVSILFICRLWIGILVICWLCVCWLVCGVLTGLVLLCVVLISLVVWIVVFEGELILFLWWVLMILIDGKCGVSIVVVWVVSIEFREKFGMISMLSVGDFCSWWVRIVMCLVV